MQTGRDQSGEMRHVGPEVSTHLVGDRPERREVQGSGVRRPAGDDHLGPGVEGDLAHLVHVDAEVFFADAVEGVLVELAGEVQAHAVGQVTAVREVEAEQRLPRFHQRLQHRGVGLRAGMRLDVGEVGAEQFLGAVARDVLHHVDVFAPAVVATARITFGVFVGEHTALRLQDRAWHEVLRRDHLQRVALTAQFAVHRGRDVRVEVGQGL